MGEECKKSVSGPVEQAEFVFINRSDAVCTAHACVQIIIIIMSAKTYNLHDGVERGGSYIILIIFIIAVRGGRERDSCVPNRAHAYNMYIGNIIYIYIIYLGIYT